MVEIVVSVAGNRLSSVRSSPKTTHFLVFRPIFGEGRLHLVWGSSIDRSSYAKSCLSISNFTQMPIVLYAYSHVSPAKNVNKNA